MNLISLKQLAQELDLDRSHARKYILRLGVELKHIRDPANGNQKMLALTEEDAARVRRAREDAGFSVNGDVEGFTEVPTGQFYVIQLVPELDARRVKLGFAADAQTRLAQHQTAAPTAVILKTWPCRRAWEFVVIDCLSALCRLIRNEVYEADSIDALLERGDQFFALMPAPDYRPPLSTHAPGGGNKEQS